MKRLPLLLCAALLCSTLTGCAYDYCGPAVGGSVAVAPSGVYAGSVSVGTTYYSSPFVVPVLPPLVVPRYHRPPPPPVYRPAPPPRPHAPAFRPAPPPRPHGPALRPGPQHGHRPPAVKPGPRSGQRPPEFRPDGPRGPRPHASHHGGGPRGGHGGPRPR